MPTSSTEVAVFRRTTRERARLERAIVTEQARWYRLSQEGTIKAYKQALHTLQEQLAALEPGQPLTVAAERAIESWTPARRHICSKLYRRLGLDVEVVKQPRPRPVPLDEAVWHRHIAAYAQSRPRTWRHWRNRAIVLTIALTGKRPVDLMSANVASWHRPLLDLVQKGGYHLTIEVPDLAADAIDDWLRHRPRDAAGEPALFIGRTAAGGVAYRRFRPMSCSRMFPAEISRRRLPQARLKDFRTTVATQLADHGPAVVAGALGHRSLSSAQFYVDPTLRQREAAAIIAAKVRDRTNREGDATTV